VSAGALAESGVVGVFLVWLGWLPMWQRRVRLALGLPAEVRPGLGSRSLTLYLRVQDFDVAIGCPPDYYRTARTCFRVRALSRRATRFFRDVSHCRTPTAEHVVEIVIHVRA
jgi:hypothetical protein